MTADDAQASGQAREVEVVARVAREHGFKNAEWIDGGRYDSHWHCGAQGCEWSDYHHPNDFDHHVAEQVHAALAPVRAAERQEAAREALEDAAVEVVADERFRPSTISRAWGLEAARVIYGLIAKRDDRADGVTGRSGT